MIVIIFLLDREGWFAVGSKEVGADKLWGILCWLGAWCFFGVCRGRSSSVMVEVFSGGYPYGVYR